MNKSIKKILVAGASLLILASVGASFSNVNISARSRRTYRVHRHHSVRRNGTKKLLKRNHHYNKKTRKISRNIKKRGHKNYLPRKYFGKWYARKESTGFNTTDSAPVSLNISKHGDYVNSPVGHAYMKFTWNKEPFFKHYRGGYISDLAAIRLVNHGKTMLFSSSDGDMGAEWSMHRVR